MGVSVSLLIDPSVLNQGASALRQYQGLLNDALATIRFEHAALKEVWTGAAADHVSAVWDELHPRIGTHFDRLGQQATGLTTAAQQLASKDQQNSDTLAATTSSLDLP